MCIVENSLAKIVNPFPESHDPETEVTARWMVRCVYALSLQTFKKIIVDESFEVSLHSTFTKCFIIEYDLLECHRIIRQHVCADQALRPACFLLHWGQIPKYIVKIKVCLNDMIYCPSSKREHGSQFNYLQTMNEQRVA